MALDDLYMDLYINNIVRSLRSSVPNNFLEPCEIL